MTTKYFAILTSQGAARLANATALGTKLKITHLAVGDGNGTLPTPDAAQTKLINQKRIAPLNMLSIDPANTSQIIAEQVIPENEGGFWIREIGLYDEDGVLIAVANCPETYKPQLQEGSGRTQTIRMILIVSGTAAITLKIDPSVVLATRQYVDDKVIEVKSYIDSTLREHEQSRNHPDASLYEKGFVRLSSSTTSDSETMAATPKAVKIAMDNASARLSSARNLSDLQNVLQARQNLELGDAATRSIGTGAGQLPDMSVFSLSRNGQNAWDILPNGMLRQVGTITLAPVGNFNPQVLGGVTYYTHYYRINFPRAFPTAQIAIVATLACYSYANQATMAGKSLSTHRDTDSGNDVSKTRFTVAYTTPNLGEVPTLHFEAIGY